MEEDFSLRGFAKAVGVSYSRVRMLVAEGRIPSARPGDGGRINVPRNAKVVGGSRPFRTPGLEERRCARFVRVAVATGGSVMAAADRVPEETPRPPIEIDAALRHRPNLEALGRLFRSLENL